MPFKSKEQERYLQINEPEIHRDWVEKYGHFKGAESFSAEECVSCDTPDGYWRGLPLCSSSGEELCISCCACNVCRSKWNMLEVGEQKAESFSAERKYQAVDVPLGMVCVLCENDKPATHRIVENGMPFFLCERHWFNYTMGAPNIDVDFSAEGRKAESFSAENYYGRNYRGFEINKEGDERQAFYYLTQGDNRIEIEFTKSVEGRRKRGDNYNYASYFYGNYPHTAEKMFETFDEALNWFDEQIDNGRMFKDFKAESFGAEDPLKYLSITGYYPKVGRSRRYSVHTGDRWNPIYYGEVSMRGDARGKWDFYWSDGDYGIEGDVRKNKSYYTLSPLYINGHFMANEGPTFQSRTQWDCVLEAIKYAYDFQPRVEGQKKKWWQFWKAESFNAEPDTIRFKVGERYTPLYYHGYGHSDIEIIRRTDKSVFVAQVDAQGNAAGNTLRYKIYTTPAVDIGGDRFPAQEYYKLTHGQPVRAGDTTKKAESFRSYKVAPDLSSYTKAELVSSIAGPQGTAAYDEVVYDPIAQSRLSAETATQRFKNYGNSLSGDTVCPACGDESWDEYSDGDEWRGYCGCGYDFDAGSALPNPLLTFYEMEALKEQGKLTSDQKEYLEWRITSTLSDLDSSSHNKKYIQDELVAHGWTLDRWGNAEPPEESVSTLVGNAESIDSFSPARLIILGASIGVALGLYNTRGE